MRLLDCWKNVPDGSRGSKGRGLGGRIELRHAWLSGVKEGWALEDEVLGTLGR
jgi:hypothetical protein